LISFAGMSLLAPIFVPAMARMVTTGITRRPAGRLAVGNLARGRRRTANTTMAVVLGVTLFTGVNVVLNSALAATRAAGYTPDDTGTVFALAFGLTGLTILVGLLGVLNTIVLSVRERAQELSLLRAVGMTVREVRRTVTIEGTLVGLVGVGLGIVLGLAGSALLMTRLPDEGLLFAPPWTLIGAVALGSLALVATSTRVVAGRAASCRPALAVAG
jgi:putative ABC transport system permease protein